MKNQFLILLFLWSITACDDDNANKEVTLPSNLLLTVDVSSSTQGLVEVMATADDVLYFDIDFGDGSFATSTTSGEASHTYAQSGTYTITATAYADGTNFIEKMESVTITADPNLGIPTTGYTSPTTYANYKLVWQDEFDGDELSDDWTFEIGTGSNGWGNNELQYYREENTSVRDGLLLITAKKESFSGQQYTSSRIVTQGKQFFTKGRVDIRAATPKGQGIWPALWMLGENFSTVGWPACGEIDIMELVGGASTDNEIHGTVHWDNSGSYASYGQGYSLSSGIFADEFHVFSIIWDDEFIKWYVDDILYNTIDITPQGLSEFHEDFFFIFNVAVGGNWPGSPNGTTVFPQRMVVDYIRVFQPE